VSAIFWVENRVTIKDDNKQNSYLVKYVSLTNNSSVFYLAKFTPSLVGVYFHVRFATQKWRPRPGKGKLILIIFLMR
jgi:hypothetical protein